MSHRVLFTALLAASMALATASSSNTATMQRFEVPLRGSQFVPARVVEIVARRFAFEPSIVEATEGERLRLLVRSADGIHGIQIKAFKVEKEVPRGGEPVVIEFTAGMAGRFPILCSEYCGDGHEDMKGMLVVAAQAASR